MPTKKPMQSKTTIDWAAHMDSEQIFQLIDKLLSFEACLYHEVLPLAIHGSRLHLGMVDPEDAGALEYVRKILGYMRCSVVPEQISPEILRSILSAYLNYTHTGQKNSGTALHKGNRGDRPGSSTSGANSSTALTIDSQGKLIPSPHAQRRGGTRPPHAPNAPDSLESNEEALPILQVNASHTNQPSAALTQLPPKQLLQELLARILDSGIGRLYFERQSQSGRILWSKDGVVQSVLEAVELSLFIGTLDELKLLVRLPLIPVQKPKQMEIERLYQNSEVLLRLRVMPGVHGERATLQVLRGAALEFYKQQQLAELSRDALRLALQLQRKVDELRDRAEDNPTLSGKLEAIPALNQLIRKVDEQLAAFRKLNHESE